MTHKQHISSQRVNILMGCILAASGIWLATTPATAGPVTGTPGSVPFTKAGVYGGVLTVVPGPGSEVLEIGYGGSDIAGTGDIYFRPGGSGSIVTQANGLRAYRSGSSARLYISGKLCLYGAGQDCRDVWPVPGGTNNWEVVTESVPTIGNVTYVQPISAYSQFGVRLGSSTSALAANPALSLDKGINVSNLGAGSALKVEGHVQSSFYTSIMGALKINGNDVWYDNREGQDSGLDADKLDGVNVTLEAANAAGCTGDVKRVACICFTFINGAKRCADLTNHP